MSDFLGVADTTLEEHAGWWVRRGLYAHDFHAINTAFTQDEYGITQIPPIREAEWIVDVGGYIGSFSRKAHARNPLAKIVTVEADPANIPAIEANCPFASVIHAACDYRLDLALCSSIFNNTSAPSNSSVFPREQVAAYDGTNWRPRPEPLPLITIEGIIERFGIDRIDICKMDVEGSEKTILPGTTSLHLIDCIVGEYHMTAREFTAILDVCCPPKLWWRRLYKQTPHQGLFQLFARKER